MDEMQRTEREVEIDRIDVRLRVDKDAVANQIQTFINVLSVEYHETFVFITTVNNVGKENKVMIPLDVILIMETVTTPSPDMPVIGKEVNVAHIKDISGKTVATVREHEPKGDVQDDIQNESISWNDVWSAHNPLTRKGWGLV